MSSILSTIVKGKIHISTIYRDSSTIPVRKYYETMVFTWNKKKLQSELIIDQDEANSETLAIDQHYLFVRKYLDYEKD